MPAIICAPRHTPTISLPCSAASSTRTTSLSKTGYLSLSYAAIGPPMIKRASYSETESGSGSFFSVSTRSMEKSFARRTDSMVPRSSVETCLMISAFIWGMRYFKTIRGETTRMLREMQDAVLFRDGKQFFETRGNRVPYGLDTQRIHCAAFFRRVPLARYDG